MSHHVHGCYMCTAPTLHHTVPTLALVTQDLRQDWRQGACLFESLLLDSDEAVNWCNWNYFAGVGNDPRNRRFKTVSQGEQYDPEAALITQWVPALSSLPVHLRHRPWLGGTAEEQGGYAAPLVDPSTQIKVEGGKGSKARG